VDHGQFERVRKIITITYYLLALYNYFVKKKNLQKKQNQDFITFYKNFKFDKYDEETLIIKYYQSFVFGTGFSVVNLHKAIKKKDLNLPIYV
jgi:hypothetical protein